MKVSIPSVIPVAIEYDLYQAHAIKMSEINIIIETFDKREHKTLDISYVPRKFKHIFDELRPLLSSDQTLQQQNCALKLIQTNTECEIILQIKEKSTKRVVFRYSEWANVEEMLLEAGLTVTDEHEEVRVIYSIQRLQAYYELAMLPQYSYLFVEAPDEDKIIESLAIIGYSIDQIVLATS
jgi:hypothetical protein